MRLLSYDTSHTSPNQSGDFRAESITIHWWGEPKNHRSGRIGGVVNWLCQSRARASAHFVVSGVEKRFACIIGLDRAAWHSANWTGNHRSVGIEMHPFDGATPKEQREADLEAAAYVVALIWHWKPKTKNVRLKGHRDWHNTECPGDRYYSHLDEIRRRAAKLYPRVDPDNPGVLTGTTDGTTKPLPDPKPTPTKDWFDMATEADLRKIIDAALDEKLVKQIPAPAYAKAKKGATWHTKNVDSYTLDKAHYAHQNAYRANLQSAAVLAIVRELASKGGISKADLAKIEDAAERGATDAINDKIVNADVTLEVKENQ